MATGLLKLRRNRFRKTSVMEGCLSKLAVGAFVLLVVTAAPRSSAASPILTLTTTTPTVTANQAFSVDVAIANVPDLFSFAVEIAIDPSKAAFAFSNSPNVDTVFSAEGDVLNHDGTATAAGDIAFGLDPFSPDTLLFIDSRACPLCNGVDVGLTPGRLFTVYFTALTDGPFDITVTNVQLQNSFVQLPDSAPSDYVIDLGGRLPEALAINAVTPTAVPEPATIGLLTVGLGAMCRRRMRVRKTAAVSK